MSTQSSSSSAGMEVALRSGEWTRHQHKKLEPTPFQDLLQTGIGLANEHWCTAHAAGQDDMP